LLKLIAIKSKSVNFILFYFAVGIEPKDIH